MRYKNCFHYEPDYDMHEGTIKHCCTPDDAKTLGDRWKMKYEIDVNECDNCKRYKSRYIEYPLTVNDIKVTNPEPYNVKPELCSVRMANSEKTYIGIYIGEIPYMTSVSFDEDEKTLKVLSVCNPMIYIPELDKEVHGYECWWSMIKDESELKDITDDDIKNQWYYKLLSRK